MNIKYLVLLCSFTTMHAMNNQVAPIDPNRTLCAKKISHAVHPNLIPHLANQIRNVGGDSDIEAGTMDVAQVILQAASDALEEKNQQVNSRVSKKNTAYVATATTLITAVITALASSYGHSSKC